MRWLKDLNTGTYKRQHIVFSLVPIAHGVRVAVRIEELGSLDSTT